MGKVILAFSGGLDTTYCVVWLRKQGYEVHTITINTGGFDGDEINEMADKSRRLGAVTHKTVNVEFDYYQKCIRYLIAGNVLKNNIYPLSVSAERVFQALEVANYAKAMNASGIAHGSTGAGNDQVRFDMIFHAIYPEADIITPIRDQNLSREEEIQFLKDNKITGDWGKASYSVNQGLWGTSVGGKETLSSNEYLPDEAFPTQLRENGQIELALHFKNGQPYKINDSKYDPVTLIKKLNEMASPLAIGRDIHVGDTIIGIKGRVGFEAPAPLIIIKAHHLLEKHVLGKNQIFLKDQLSLTYGNLMHEGQYLDPSMRDIEAFFDSTQQKVTGIVFIRLLPYRFILLGVESPHDLMQAGNGKYGEMNEGWSGQDVRGFSKIFGNQTMIYNKIHGQ